VLRASATQPRMLPPVMPMIPSCAGCFMVLLCGFKIVLASGKGLAVLWLAAFVRLAVKPRMEPDHFSPLPWLVLPLPSVR
jgi:hypothetical protein